MVADLGETGRLDVWGREWTAELSFTDGRLVAARCGECEGAAALAKLVAVGPAADFKFTPETASAAPANVQARIEPTTSSARSTLVLARRQVTMVCPLLGFVDDPENHFERPTSLHRCYANCAAPAISYAEQSDRCLSGQFSVCPRFTKRQDPAAWPPRDVSQVVASPFDTEPAAEPVRGGKERVKDAFLPTVSIVMALAALVLLLVFRTVPQAV
jgi:hypothetical protein